MVVVSQYRPIADGSPHKIKMVTAGIVYTICFPIFAIGFLLPSVACCGGEAALAKLNFP